MDARRRERGRSEQHMPGPRLAQRISRPARRWDHSRNSMVNRTTPAPWWFIAVQLRDGCRASAGGAWFNAGFEAPADSVQDAVQIGHTPLGVVLPAATILNHAAGGNE